ncbi:transcription factor Jun-like [Aptenodytes patagonicus]|uniref:transcription factor Jun-like n=1 Tax=Aptenodytes patagonicus TaxID=9234 RepID=UPI003FA14DAC
MSGGRNGRTAVKMEAPFYREEGLELLSDLVPLVGFSTAGGLGAATEQKLLGAAKKRDLAAAAFSSLLPGPFSLRPPGNTRSSAMALHLLPPAPAANLLLGSGVGSGEGGVGARGDPEAPLGSVVELPLLKLPPATDLEQLLIQISSGLGPDSPGPTAPTPGASVLIATMARGPFLYWQPVTQEQEGFTDSFVKALADLHKQNQLLAAPPLSSSGPCCLSRSGPATTDPQAVNTTLTSFNPAGPLRPSSSSYPAAMTPPGLVFGDAGLENGRLLPAPGPARPLEELQTVPDMQMAAGGDGGSSTPVLSLLDTESQEQLKAEWKQLRNQIAASKCQRWKLERIARLEEKVKALKGQNAELATTANLLRAQVMQLQGRIHSHLSSSCHINTTSPAVMQPHDMLSEVAAVPEMSTC